MAPVMSTLALGLACATLASAHKLLRPASFSNSDLANPTIATTTSSTIPSTTASTAPPTTHSTTSPVTSSAGVLVKLTPHHLPAGPLPDFHVPAALMAQLEDIKCIHAGDVKNGWDCFGVLKPGLTSLDTAATKPTGVVVVQNRPGDEGVVVETPKSIVLPAGAGVLFGSGTVPASSRKMKNKTTMAMKPSKSNNVLPRDEPSTSMTTLTIPSTRPVNLQITGAGGLPTVDYRVFTEVVTGASSSCTTLATLFSCGGSVDAAGSGPAALTSTTATVAAAEREDVSDELETETEELEEPMAVI